MKNVFSLLFTVCLVLSLSSCDKTENETCLGLEPIYIQLDQLCSSLIDATLEENLYVINSEAELSSNPVFKAFKGDCNKNSQLLDVDYSQYTVIIGRTKVAGTVASITNQSVVKNCNNNLITYYVTVKNGGFTEIGSCVFAVKILKQSSAIKYNHEIRIVN